MKSISKSCTTHFNGNGDPQGSNFVPEVVVTPACKYVEKQERTL